ncbi:MAG: FISUMP domain-containing protein [Pseudomonadales bacterium]
MKPRGIILNEAQDTLWIGDPGSSQDAARIIKVPVTNGEPGQPSIFYMDPSVLIKAKWAFPTTLNMQEVLLVADQGEVDQDGNFTGAGAKILIIPVEPGNTAGIPQVVWSGNPFVCPTGIVRVGDYALITDPCAGPLISRVDDPQETLFPSSILFALHLNGLQTPFELHQGSPFTSMIGICLYVPGTVLVNDTDAGRLDPTSTGGRAGFAPPAGAEKFIFDFIDENSEPPHLSPPKRQAIYEEGTLQFQFSDFGHLAEDTQIFVTIEGGDHFILDRFNDIAPTRNMIFYLDDLDAQGNLSFNVASSTLLNYISVMIDVDNFWQKWEIQKDETQSNMFVDNKHAGAVQMPQAVVVGEEQYNRFTVDQGSASVWIYPDEGGTPVRIAQGGIINQPLSGQLSADAQNIWIVDKANSSLYQISFPGPETFQELFPFRKKFNVILGWSDKNVNVAQDIEGTTIGWCWNATDHRVQRENTSHCQEFGRLYDYNEAIAACESLGRELPTKQDWYTLRGYVGGKTVAGYHLKSSETRYAEFAGKPPALDDFGFTALLGGGVFAGTTTLAGGNGAGYWWSSSLTEDGSQALFYMMKWYKDSLMHEWDPLSSLLSVRCISR